MPTFLSLLHPSGKVYKEVYSNMIGWDGNEIRSLLLGGFNTHTRTCNGPACTQGCELVIDLTQSEQLVRYVAISVESKVLQLNRNHPEDHARRSYEGYEELRRRIDSMTREACGSEVMMTDLDGKFVYMHNQFIYRTSALRGALIGVAIAFAVIFVSTWSLLMATASTLCILATLVSVVGLVTMRGWELGTVEAILISILAGFSVDYTVHFAHCYAASTSGRR